MESYETPAGRPAGAAGLAEPPLVSIVIPAYNEAQRIGESIRRIAQFLQRTHLSAEIIVVDDGSRDGTASIVEEFCGLPLRLIQNRQNQGKGYAVRQGVLAANGTYVLFTDADLSAPIEELEKLLRIAREDGADVVIGSRAIDRRYIQKHQSRFRELGGIFYNWMVQLLLGLRLHDTQCGFKLFHRENARPIFEKQTTPGFGFDCELLFLAKQRRLRISEVPVLWSHSEGSKIRVLADGIRMLSDIVRIRWNSLAGRYE